MVNDSQIARVGTGMTTLPREIEEWLMVLPERRLVQMARSVRGQERIIGAGTRACLVVLAAKSDAAIQAGKHFETTGQLTPEQENDMTPKQIAAASMEDLVARYNELNPEKPLQKFQNIEKGRERVTAAEQKFKDDTAAAKKAASDEKKAADKAIRDAARAEKDAERKAAKEAKAAEPRKPRQKFDYTVTFKEGGTSKVRETSERGAVLAQIKNAGADGILKSQLDVNFEKDTLGFIQKLEEVGHVTAVKIEPAAEPAAE